MEEPYPAERRTAPGARREAAPPAGGAAAAAGAAAQDHLGASGAASSSSQRRQQRPPRQRADRDSDWRGGGGGEEASGAAAAAEGGFDFTGDAERAKGRSKGKGRSGKGGGKFGGGGKAAGKYSSKGGKQSAADWWEHGSWDAGGGGSSSSRQWHPRLQEEDVASAEPADREEAGGARRSRPNRSAKGKGKGSKGKGAPQRGSGLSDDEAPGGGGRGGEPPPDSERAAQGPGDPAEGQAASRRDGGGTVARRRGGGGRGGKGRFVAGDDAATVTERLMEQLGRGTYDCMICLNKVARSNPIWSCDQCWAAFHLKCIHQWIRKSNDNSTTTDFAFQCPGCRYHHVGNLPEYTCYCGRLLEPDSNPHYMAHSCGEVCQRPRTCPHPCTQLCHPGPCPPCTAVGGPGRCHCGRESLGATRCGDPTRWACHNACDRPLACGRHTCTLRCHAGPCPKCSATSPQKCHCGKTESQRLCGQENFSCGEPCGRLLECGSHICERTCHEGDCGPCPRSPATWGDRCACGNTKNCQSEAAAAFLVRWVGKRMKCGDPLPLCGSRCNRTLPCGHQCRRTCHDGPCGKCEERVTRACRCGRTKKEVACNDTTEVLCTQPCKTKKSCGIHRCDVVCCPAVGDRNHEAHFCLQVCGRPMACGFHTCEEFCHLGKCPPCRVVLHEPLCCACGEARVEPPVICGTRPPVCNRICGVVRECGHPCQVSCHFGDHPLCCELVDRLCIGGHREMRNIPCHVGRSSCGQPCGKPLPCGHRCITLCHGGECPSTCTQPCGAPRVHCEHRCTAPCHVGLPCEDTPCQHRVRSSCPCGLRVEDQRCGAFSGRPRGGGGVVGTAALKCGPACEKFLADTEQQLATLAQHGRGRQSAMADDSNAEEAYAADLRQLAMQHRSFVRVLDAIFAKATSSAPQASAWATPAASSTALPTCDGTRRLLAVEYARLHWRLSTSSKQDALEGWWVVHVQAVQPKPGANPAAVAASRAPWPTLSELAASPDSAKYRAALGMQPRLRFTGVRSTGEEVYDVVGLDGLLGVRPAHEEGEVLAFVDRSDRALATFRRLTGRDPGDAAVPVRPEVRAGAHLRVALETQSGQGRASGAGAMRPRDPGDSGAAAAKALAAAPKATAAPAQPAVVPDSWEDEAE